MSEDKYLVVFYDPSEVAYMTSVLHQHDDSGDWLLDGPEPSVTAMKSKGLTMPYDIATYFAALFDGEVIEK